MASLRDRLEAHSQAFTNLLSLIPAKRYYSGDPSTEWRKKKQTKAQSARAKRAKLDPDAVCSAADVKRVGGEVQIFGEEVVKLEGDDGDDDDGGGGGDDKGKRRNKKKKNKKRGKKGKGASKKEEEEGGEGEDVGEKAEEIQLDGLTFTARLDSPDADAVAPDMRAKSNAKRGIEDLGSAAGTAPDAQGQAKRQRRKKDTGSRMKEVDPTARSVVAAPTDGYKEGGRMEASTRGIASENQNA